jgi:hypothetical protein
MLSANDVSCCMPNGIIGTSASPPTRARGSYRKSDFAGTSSKLYSGNQSGNSFHQFRGKLRFPLTVTYHGCLPNSFPSLCIASQEARRSLASKHQDHTACLRSNPMQCNGKSHHNAGLPESSWSPSLDDSWAEPSRSPRGVSGQAKKIRHRLAPRWCKRSSRVTTAGS